MWLVLNVGMGIFYSTDVKQKIAFIHVTRFDPAKKTAGRGRPQLAHRYGVVLYCLPR